MNVGLIAHDSKKKLMQNFCIAYKGILSKHNLYATGTTGKLIEEVTNLNIHKFLPGHLGGEQQMGAQIENNDIDLVIFLRDPLSPEVPRAGCQQGGETLRYPQRPACDKPCDSRAF